MLRCVGDLFLCSVFLIIIFFVLEWVFFKVNIIKTYRDDTR